MTKEQLQQGFASLNELSREDYRGVTLEDLGKQAVTPDEAWIKVGRLVGVELKQPFATPRPLTTPAPVSGAYRAWDLDVSSFAKQSSTQTWQYRALTELIKEKPQGREFASVLALAEDAHHERGFFGYFAHSLAKYICGDPKMRKKIETEIKKGQKAGLALSNVTPETVVQGGGVALASLLVGHIPLLGFVGAPVIAGIVFIFYKIGVDAFCTWVNKTGAEVENR
jgi:hypothetical protein